jgi:hypothetical protein
MFVALLALAAWRLTHVLLAWLALWVPAAVFIAMGICRVMKDE